MDYSPEAIAQALSGGPTPTPGAQDKFNRIADALMSGLKSAFEFPGNYMASGIDRDAAVNWAAPMALGMVGAPMAPADALGSGAKVIGMRDWQVARDLGGIKQRNLRETFSDNGGGIIKELPNQWSIGYRPGSSTEVNHVLLSPQGAPALYGRSPADLVKRGFPDEEIPDLLNVLKKYGVSSVAALPPAIQATLPNEAKAEGDPMMPPNGMPPQGMQPPVPIQPPQGMPGQQIDPAMLAQLLMAQGGGVPGGPPGGMPPGGPPMGGPPGMPPQGMGAPMPPQPPQPPMMGPAGQGQLRRY